MADPVSAVCGARIELHPCVIDRCGLPPGHEADCLGGAGLSVADPVSSSDEAVEAAATAIERAVGGQLAHDPHDPERYYRFAAEDVLHDVTPIIAARVRAGASTRAHDCEVAAAALMGVVGEIDDDAAAQVVERRAGQFEAEARSARGHSDD